MRVQKTTKEQMPKGFQAWGMACGIKDSGNKDLGIVVSNPPSRVFGAFTTNRFCAAPVSYCKEELAQKGDSITHLLVNSGNANACTGKQGEQDTLQAVDAVRRCFEADKPQGVLMCSTGIIGQPLPMKTLHQGIEALSENSVDTKRDPMSFAEAILTTDTCTKMAVSHLDIPSGEAVNIWGVAKGSGMISPNMATMLAYVLTDIQLPPRFQSLFLEMVEKSFNSISVDGDMSTNDTVLLMANGSSGISYESLTVEEQQTFCQSIQDTLLDLAKQIVRDGEGATKCIEINILKASNESESKALAQAVANSPLVKTAFFGADPNWGRVVGALGSIHSGLNPEKVDLSFCGHPVLKMGQPVMMSEGEQKALEQAMKAEEVSLEVHLHTGEAKWTYWTCDLTYDYVKINAEYHT
jgi:glutamate N-acetyltransferase/amino-acid N-acetyltransferase